MGLNPAQLRPDLPGRLDFNFGARGEGFGGGTLDVDVRELRGTLRGTAARGSGSVATARYDLDVQQGRRRRRWRARPARRHARRERARFHVPARGERPRRARAAEPRHAARAAAACAAPPGAGAGARGERPRPRPCEGLEIGSLDADVDFDPRAGRAARGCAPPRAGSQGFGRAARQRLAVTLDGQSEDHRLGIDVQCRRARAARRGRRPLRRRQLGGTWNRLDLDVGEQVRPRARRHDGDERLRDRRLDRPLLPARRQDREDSPARLCAAGDWGAGAGAARSTPRACRSRR
jgi:hypothetical protein